LIDLHTHSLFSDGELLPSELMQRARKKGYEIIAITDHADASNIEYIIKNVKKACADFNSAYKDIKCLAGVELTHIPPVHVKKLAAKARKAGAQVVVFHGETVVEPVESGSNRAAIEAKVDILAHPGMISESDAALAARNGVALEITARGGHNRTNRHVAAMARKTGAMMVFDTDTHTPYNLVDDKQREKILKDAGLNAQEIAEAINNSRKIAGKKK
jgi:putative hydrolase